MKAQSQLERFDEFPPFVVYALAREGGRHGRHLSTSAVSRRSGLPERTCIRVSGKLSWRGVKVEVLDAFCYGCDFDWENLQKQRTYLYHTRSAANPFNHLNARQKNKLMQRRIRWEKLKERGWVK